MTEARLEYLIDIELDKLSRIVAGRARSLAILCTRRDGDTRQSWRHTHEHLVR